MFEEALLKKNPCLESLGPKNLIHMGGTYGRHIPLPLTCYVPPLEPKQTRGKDNTILYRIIWQQVLGKLSRKFMDIFEKAYRKKQAREFSVCQFIWNGLFQRSIKGPCATLVVCGRAVLSERASKPYMNCKQQENIRKAIASNYYGSPVPRDL